MDGRWGQVLLHAVASDDGEARLVDGRFLAPFRLGLGLPALPPLLAAGHLDKVRVAGKEAGVMNHAPVVLPRQIVLVQ